MQEIRVLDCGYVKLIESWGSDERVIEAARMSTAKGFTGWGKSGTCEECGSKGWHHGECHPSETCDICDGKGTMNTAGDEKLLRYLYEHKHHTPFEMCGLSIEVQAPLFVFREWHRHRTQSYNEMSSRYTPMPDLYYVPSVERIINGGQSSANKQGAGALWRDGDSIQVEALRQTLLAHYQATRALYQCMLDDGIAREIARIVLPVAQYSRMRASANLRNWLGFLTLRLDPAAQLEIRLYAQAVGDIVSDLFPRTWELFNEKVTK